MFIDFPILLSSKAVDDDDDSGDDAITAHRMVSKHDISTFVYGNVFFVPWRKRAGYTHAKIMAIVLGCECVNFKDGLAVIESHGQ